MSPGYRTYEAMTGGPAVAADALATAPGRSLVIGNPNNPDGRTTSRVRLHALLDGLAGSSDWLVVDEAFADICPDISIADVIEEDARLIVFRSFGKFFGLAGVRLGFVLGPRAVIAHFRDRLGSWPVSAAAIAIGARAYCDVDWIAAAKVRLRSDAAALDGVLAAHGLTPTGDCPLFRLVETDDAAALFDRLARRAILTRPFDYAPNWLRIGLPGSAKALDRLDRALAHG
jgi:cobalamin biosynthetic protein CobC